MMTLNRVVLFSNEIHSEASGYVMSCWWNIFWSLLLDLQVDQSLWLLAQSVE